MRGPPPPGRNVPPPGRDPGDPQDQERVCKTIDNRGGKRDWKRLYVYANDARDGHMTLTKFGESHNYVTPAKAVFVALERYLVHSSRVAPGLEAKKRKNRAVFLNRFVGGLPIGLVEFSWDLYLVQAFVKRLARLSISQRVLTMPSSTSLL